MIQWIKYDPKLINGDEFTTRKLTCSLVAYTMQYFADREAYGESGEYAAERETRLME